MVVSVKNLTSKEVILKAGTVIGKIEAANTVPPMLAPKSDHKEESKESMDLNTDLNLEWLLSKGQSTTVPD